jgi:hypothetical protein
VTHVWILSDSERDRPVGFYSSKENAEAVEAEYHKDKRHGRLSIKRQALDELMDWRHRPIHRLFIRFGEYDYHWYLCETYGFRHPEKVVFSRQDYGIEVISPVSFEDALVVGKRVLASMGKAYYGRGIEPHSFSDRSMYKTARKNPEPITV